MDKIWNIKPHTLLTSTRMVRRVILDERLPAGWPIKWGGKYDVAIQGKLVPTGLTCLNWSAQQWIDFIKKHSNDKL